MTSTDLAIRHFVYQHFIAETRPPTPAETARAFNLTEAEARAAYQRLHDHHFFFLDPGTMNIRLANPLSAIPTDYKVTANGKSYWANCAWDMLGIPAMLHQDAVIEARFAGAGEEIEIIVKDGQMSLRGRCSSARSNLPIRVGGLLRQKTARNDVSTDMDLANVVIHFLLPFRQWYDDLIYT